MTGGCDGDDNDVDDFEDVDNDNDVDDIEDSDDVEDGDVAILISQSIVILSFFFTREKLDALLRNRKFMQNKVRGKLDYRTTVLISGRQRKV